MTFTHVGAARPRVLVIDDDDDVCEILREALTEDGYAVATVPHGAAALELIHHHQPAVILLDLRMPIMDGWSSPNSTGGGRVPPRPSSSSAR